MGYDPDAFWRQTPATFASAMRGAMARLRRSGERDIALAHATASLTRAQPLEPLDRYLPRRRRRDGSMTMLDRLKDIAERTAGLS